MYSPLIWKSETTKELNKCNESVSHISQGLLSSNTLLLLQCLKDPFQFHSFFHALFFSYSPLTWINQYTWTLSYSHMYSPEMARFCSFSCSSCFCFWPAVAGNSWVYISLSWGSQQFSLSVLWFAGFITTHPIVRLSPTRATKTVVFRDISVRGHNIEVNIRADMISRFINLLINERWILNHFDNQIIG